MAKEVAISGGISSTITSNNYDYEGRIASLTPEEKTRYVAMTTAINTKDINTIQNYGAELSRVVATNGNTLLSSVRADNSSAVVELTNDLLAELNMIDIDELNTQSGWKRFLRRLPLVNKLVTSVSNIMNKYDTIAANVDKISHKIDSAKVVAIRDNNTLQNIFDNNVSYIEQMRDLILAAKIKEQELDAQINEMQQHPENYESYEISDMMDFRNNLQKRIADMQTTEYVMNQNLYQIRATQGNNVAIANKSDNIVNNIIPLWKNQLAIAVIINNQKASIEAQKKITDTTNEILRKNAQNLKINSINTAKANEEQVINLDTLRETTDNLIETIREVKRIHDEGAKSRKEIETSLASYAKNLEDAINDINS